jgi:hypothetical protein
MRLGSVSVWFPVLHLRAEVTYRLLPELTPLHRALEAAVKEFSRGNNALAAAPIPELFRKLFGVSGAQEIMPDVLCDLIERGRVHRVAEDENDPLLLRIIDLAPGQSAAALAPGSNLSETEKQAAQTREIERFFDSVLEEIVGGTNLAPQAPDDRRFCVPVEPFLMHPPTLWVERELRTELHDDVQIFTANSELVGHRWRRSEAELVLKDGELSVECSDSRESEYLRGLSQRVRGSWLLPNSLDRSRRSLVEEGAEFSIHCMLPPNLGGLVLTRGLPETTRAELAFPQSVVVANLDPAVDIQEPTIISVSAQGQTLQVAYPRNDNADISGVFWATEGREFFRLSVIWEGLHAEIGVFRSTIGFLSDGSAWSEVIAALETECRYSGSPEIFLLPALWLDPADFWRRLAERLGSEVDNRKWMADVVNALQKLPPAALARLSENLHVGGPLTELRSNFSELATLFPSVPEKRTRTVLAKRVRPGAAGDGIALLPAFCKRVIAFDTSSFIRYGQLVEHLQPSDFLVNPQVVAAEVERQKTNSEDFRIASRRNLRAIDRLPKGSWTAPFHDFNQLFPSDIRNNDGAIIATLVPYCQPGIEVIVVSEDHDFLLRSRPYGIEWMNAETFLYTSRTIITEAKD